MIDKDPGALLGQAQVYTDLAGLQQLKAEGHRDKAAALRQVAKQFESMFIQMMMKSMREANTVFSEGDALGGDSSEAKLYQEMFDNQLSLTLAKGRGIGIADALLRQLQNRYPDTAGATGDTSAAPAADSHALPRARVPVTGAPGASAAPDAAAVQDVLRSLFSGRVDAAPPATDTGDTADAASYAASPADFIAALTPAAQRIAQEIGVDSRVLLSQAALETGWGRKVLQRADGSSSNNFFNIKADADWQGAVVTVPTIEYRDGVAVRETATFRAYETPEAAFADYAKLVLDNPRYADAVRSAGDSNAYMRALADAGYATDPQYADKVLALLRTGHLQRETAGTAADGTASL